MKRGLQLRRIRLISPKSSPKDVSFGPGLNVLYGGSNTGKSHLVALVDFAFGGRTKPSIPPEGAGYDALLATIELPDQSTVTLCRSFAGGGIRIVDGIIDRWPADKEGILYAEQHGRGRSLSAYLLELLGIPDKRIRKNAAGDTRDLSFRDLVHLFVIDETKIQSKVSPIETGQVMLKTAELSAFKFVLTGIDDGKLDSVRLRSDVRTRQQIELEFVDREIADLTKTLEDSETDRGDLTDQKEKLDTAFDQEFTSLTEIESPYRDMLARRRTVRHSIELLTERNDEIELLLERFDMLRLHYESDTSRLEGVVEAGTFFEILEAGYCPLCGAAADHQGDSTECEANVSQITSAAGGEIAKIKVRQQELAATIERLRTELESIPARLDREFGRLSQIDNSLSKERPDIQAAKSRIREIMDARADVQTKLEVFSRLDSYKERRKTVAGDDGADSTAAIAATEIPGSIRSEFETKIEQTLKDWKFSDGGRVLFDVKSRDIEINGKPRAANGKGVRSILHAAFSISLAQFCAERSHPQPGFLILDSPLLTYRDPLDSPDPQAEDDKALAATDLRERVFECLRSWPEYMQLIIVENVDLPDWVMSHSNTTVFTGKRGYGRAGLY